MPCQIAETASPSQAKVAMAWHNKWTSGLGHNVIGPPAADESGLMTGFANTPPGMGEAFSYGRRPCQRQ